MRGVDWWIGGGLAALAAVFLVLRVDLNVAPAEDAAMLMRYAVHLAGGHGIVWNIGEPPVDGATDFLYMVLIAALVKGGLSPEAATRLLNLVAHLLTVVLVYWSGRRWLNAPVWSAALAAFYLAVSAAPFYVATCFGAPLFACFAFCAWLCALQVILKEPTPASTLGFGAFSLLTGLTRPEGVLLTLGMLVAIAMARGIRSTLPALGAWLAFVGGLGGIYFLWRWDYFGYPLPNPYYKKGGGTLHWDGLENALHNFLNLNLPLVALAILGAFSRPSRRTLGALITPALGFVLCFLLISPEMNLYGRFQYATLPLMLPVALYALARLREHLRVVWQGEGLTPGRLRAAVIALAFGFVYAYTDQTLYKAHPKPFTDGRYTVARRLAPLSDRGYTMAVTEAGLLPFYSGWKAIDTWGLNDPWIAHRGLITLDYLRASRPALVMMHAHWTPLTPVCRRHPWDAMCLVIQEFVQREGYLLAAAYTDNPYRNSCHYYYVRADLPPEVRAQIIAAVQVPEYTYWSGERAIDLVPFLTRRTAPTPQQPETRYNTADADDRTGEP